MIEARFRVNRKRNKDIEVLRFFKDININIYSNFSMANDDTWSINGIRDIIKTILMK